MTPEEAREQYDFDRGLSHVDPGEQVTASDGTEFVVLESTLGGHRRVVHADVVDYGTHDHPILTGVIGLFIIGSAFALPVFAGFKLALSDVHVALRLAAAAVGVVGGFALSNLLLYRTLIGGWLFRFLEWNDYRSLIMAERGGA